MKKKEVGGLALSHSNIYFKAAIIRWHGINIKVNRSADDVEHPERVPPVSHLINDKDDIGVHWKNEDLSSENDAESTR